MKDVKKTIKKRKGQKDEKDQLTNSSKTKNKSPKATLKELRTRKQAGGKNNEMS